MEHKEKSLDFYKIKKWELDESQDTVPTISLGEYLFFLDV